MCRLLLLALIFTLGPNLANAFTCTAAVGGGNWNSAASWTTCNSTFPQAADDVVLDVTGGNIVINVATNNLKSFNMTGYLGTLSGSSTLNIIGATASTQTVLFAGTITWTGTLAFAPTTSTTNLNFTSGGKLFTLITIAGNASAVVQLQDNLSFTAVKTDNLTLSVNSLDMNGKTISGNSATNRLLIRSNTLGTQRTITINSGTFAYADFSDINLSTNTNLSAITGNSGDCGGNSNITFTTGATQTWNGTSGGNWSANAWSGRVPLPQDDVAIASAFSASQTITEDMPRAGKSISWIGASGSPNFFISVSGSFATIYGSLTMISGMTYTNSGTNVIFGGRGSFLLTSAGKSFSNIFYIRMISGTLTSQDAMSATNVVVENGTLDLGGFNATVVGQLFLDNTGVARALVLGSGTLALTGVGSIWSATSSGLTLTSTGSTIVISNVSATLKSFVGAAQTYNNFTLSGDNIAVSGANVFNGAFAVNNAGLTNGLKLTSGVIQAIAGTFVTNGSAGNLAKLSATTPGSAATLSKTSGTVAVDYMALTDSAASGGATWCAGANSTGAMGAGNSGWLFQACSAVKHRVIQ